MKTLIRNTIIGLILLSALSLAWGDQMPARRLLAREGKGYLERVGTQLVLHLRGTPKEMGHQYGVLLREDIRANFRTLDRKGLWGLVPLHVLRKGLLDVVWQRESPFIPARYLEEMKALAAGAGVSFNKVRRLNSLPELFHCSGFALFGGATKDGALYHGRVLDYVVKMGLQDHNVVIITEPDGAIPYASVSYAGMVGVITGMNREGVSLGEMGGAGFGHWRGMPMSLLMRRALEEAHTLADAQRIFRTSRRTCQYFYVIGDSKIPGAVGVAATQKDIFFVQPNQAVKVLNVPIKDAVVLSLGDRYRTLTSRITRQWGNIDAAAARDLMRRPVARGDNLHCVLMAPKTQELWVAHASHTGQPASEQPYQYLNIEELMRHEPL